MQVQANQQKKRAGSKLGSCAVLSVIAELAKSGATLSQICTHLVQPIPMGFGIDVSRVSIFRRLEAAGIKLKSGVIGSKAPHQLLSPESPAVSRVVSLEAMARHKSRKSGDQGSWLKQFANEIDELQRNGYTYRGIWNLMAERYPLVPQFSLLLTDKQKTDRLAVFVMRQRKRNGTKASSMGHRLHTPAYFSKAYGRSESTPVAPKTNTSVSTFIELESSPARTRASLPTASVNITDLRRAQEIEGIATRTNLSAIELEEVHRLHGLLSKNV